MIIDRYIAREVTYTLLAVFGVLMIILVSHQFVRYLADAAAGEIPVDMLLTLLGLRTIGFAGLALPLSLFLAVLISLGRLYRDSEMVVMAACGIGTLRILVGVMRGAFVVVLILAFFSLYFNPWVAERRSQFMAQMRAKPELVGISAGRFHESSRGDAVYFVERLDSNGTLDNIFIQYRRPGGISGILAASNGYQEFDPKTKNRFLILRNGHRYEDAPSEFRMMDYDQHGILIPLPHVEKEGRGRDAMSTAQLWGSSAREDQAELQWRLALPLAAMLFAALGVPLSYARPREGRYGKLFTGILIYMIFSNLLGVARNWLERGIMPIEFGLWWVNGLLFMLVIMMLRTVGRRVS